MEKGSVSSTSLARIYPVALILMQGLLVSQCQSLNDPAGHIFFFFAKRRRLERRCEKKKGNHGAKNLIVAPTRPILRELEKSPNLVPVPGKVSA